MKFMYVFSVICLLISFLMYRKSNKALNIVSWIVYSICLLFCYNTLIVYLISFLKLGGSLFIYSLLNYIVSCILFSITIRKKNCQKYKIDKKEMLVSLAVILVIAIIGYIRFDGLNSISYESSDSAVHYKQSTSFARELSILNEKNTNDLVYVSFKGAMPIYYVNTGFLLNIFSNLKSYKLFMFLDIFYLEIYALLFMGTIFKILEKKQKNYFYMFILILLYTLAFPLNNLLFGFGYMGMGIMVVNLLFLTMLSFKDKLNDDIFYKIIVLFIINFSVFFSYYLYMPPVYLALGIYYIYLCKKKKMSTKNLFIFGIVTLIIPFIIGFSYFMLPSFIDNNSGNSFTYVNIWGYIYNNSTPIIMLLILTIYLIYLKVKNKVKFDYFYLNFYIITMYTVLFLYLYVFKLSEIYYFYKLFYLYWVFVIILLAKKLINQKKILYITFSLIIISMISIMIFPKSDLSKVLAKINIYNWNAKSIGENNLRFNEKEIELMEESIKYKDTCSYNDEFILISSSLKPKWYYSITNIIPLYNYKSYTSHELDKPTISLDYWNYIDHPCAIYYFDDEIINDYDEKKLDDYDILFENKEGMILRKK